MGIDECAWVDLKSAVPIANVTFNLIFKRTNFLFINFSCAEQAYYISETDCSNLNVSLHGMIKSVKFDCIAGCVAVPMAVLRPLPVMARYT